VAIKGKGRTRGRRVVAAPPRPQLVVRKPPIWRRPWVLIVVGVLAAGGILAGVLISMHSSNVKKLKNEEAAAVGKLTQQFVAQFPEDNQTVPPDLYYFYPTLPDDLDKLAAGKLKVEDADALAQKVLDSSTKAAAGIGKVSVEKLIPARFTVSRVAGAGGKGITREELIDARFLMQRSFNLWASVATVIKAAGEAEGAKQKALVDDAKQLANEASELFAQGWRTVVRIQTRLGIQAPSG
jgi:hypothetical protein